jgi:predicted thioredoxin/glutaredoxin
MYEIVIFGAKCGKCKKVESLIKKVITDNHIEATTIKNESWEDMAFNNVTYIPSVMLDGKIVFKGIIPTENQILKLFNLI